MIIMFLMIVIIGSIPLRSKEFKENGKLLALSAAFSGGLFLSVGILHILPEASENFNDYYDDGKEHFPFAFFTTVMSFALILFIEKIAVDHHHSHSEDNHVHAKKSIAMLTNKDYTDDENEKYL